MKLITNKTSRSLLAVSQISDMTPSTQLTINFSAACLCGSNLAPMLFGVLNRIGAACPEISLQFHSKTNGTLFLP
ncbi:MAG: hypothetical protein ACTS78_02915 [Arsenophonus sp. NC-WZS1-MAG3]